MRRGRRLVLMGMLGSLGLAGCNPAMLYFMMGGGEDKIPPEYPLTVKGRKKSEPVRVLVLTSCAIDTPVDFIGIDRMLASEFTQAMNVSIQENKENVQIIPVNQVEKFKADHPNWKSMDPSEIGKDFKADFILDFEIMEIRLYNPRSKEMMQGWARISGDFHDLNAEQGEPKKIEYSLEYPRGYEVTTLDRTPSRFRQDFLRRIAQELSWKFTPHHIRAAVGKNQVLD
jgi:hypothetical protein